MRICNLPPTLLLIIAVFPTEAIRADILAGMLGPQFADGSVPRFEDDGTPIPGSGIPQFSGGIGLPGGVTVGPDGNIYVASLNGLTGAGEILRYDGQTLAFIDKFGEMPSNPPPMPGENPVPPSPARLKFGPDGNLYVADMAGASVRIFDGQTGGLLPDTLNTFAGPTGLTFGPDGTLYVGNFGAGSVDKVVNGVKESFIAPGTSPLATPSSMIILSNGDMIVVDLFFNQLLRYDSEGNFIPKGFDEDMKPIPFARIPPEIPSPPPAGLNPSNNPSDIMFDEDGNLLVGVLGLTYPPETPGTILRYDLEGNLLEIVVEDVRGVSSLAWIPAEGAITGDYDSDGSVDADDYGKWVSRFGGWVAPRSGAEGSGNGIIDAADYVLWRDHLGTQVASQLATVPEPTGLALALLGFGWFARRRVSPKLANQQRLFFLC